MEISNNNLLSYSKIVQDKTLEFKDDADTKIDLENNFKWLHRNILENDRKISVLDFYRIEGSAKKDNIFTIFNNMLRNTSVYIEEDCEIGSLQLGVGDLLYKAGNGQPQVLRIYGGYYIPNFQAENKISWFYNGSSSPSKDNKLLEWTLKERTDQELKAYNKIYSIEEGNKNWNNIDTNWPVIYLDPETKLKPSIPIVKGFHKDDNGYEEEVYWDFSLKIVDKENNEKIWELSKIPSYISKITVK